MNFANQTVWLKLSRWKKDHLHCTPTHTSLDSIDPQRTTGHLGLGEKRPNPNLAEVLRRMVKPANRLTWDS